MANGHYADDMATGKTGRPLLRIAGRPPEGGQEQLVIWEEPGEAVLTHYLGRRVPHFRRGCPNCLDKDGNRTDEPKPMWYVGGSFHPRGDELVIVELTEKCYRSLAAAARERATTSSITDLFGQPIEKVSFVGLVAVIRRGSFRNSPRILRCSQRVKVKEPWPYRTREELARIWGVPVRPRLFRSDQA